MNLNPIQSLLNKMASDAIGEPVLFIGYTVGGWAKIRTASREYGSFINQGEVRETFPHLWADFETALKAAGTLRELDARWSEWAGEREESRKAMEAA